MRRTEGGSGADIRSQCTRRLCFQPVGSNLLANHRVMALADWPRGVAGGGDNAERAGLGTRQLTMAAVVTVLRPGIGLEKGVLWLEIRRQGRDAAVDAGMRHGRTGSFLFLRTGSESGFWERRADEERRGLKRRGVLRAFMRLSLARALRNVRGKGSALYLSQVEAMTPPVGVAGLGAALRLAGP